MEPSFRPCDDETAMTLLADMNPVLAGGASSSSSASELIHGSAAKRVNTSIDSNSSRVCGVTGTLAAVRMRCENADRHDGAPGHSVQAEVIVSAAKELRVQHQCCINKYV